MGSANRTGSAAVRGYTIEVLDESGAVVYPQSGTIGVQAYFNSTQVEPVTLRNIVSTCLIMNESYRIRVGLITQTTTDANTFIDVTVVQYG